MLILLLFGLAFFVFAAFLVGEAVTVGARQRSSSIRRASTWGRRSVVVPQRLEPLKERALLPLKEKLARAVLRLNPKQTVETVALRLLAAGLARRISPLGFLSGKAVLGLLGLVFGLLLGAGSGPVLLLFLALVLGTLGFVGPDVIVSARARARREEIRAALPDALDLLAVSVEAGLGFDGAIVKLTEQMGGPLAEEFALTLSEMRIGESRQEALRKLAERVDAPELSAFARAIIQADQFGISLGRILRVQASDTRQRRQSAAEERAMKAPIKMLFPTVVFIFPAMFLVTLGPAFLNLAKVL